MSKKHGNTQLNGYVEYTCPICKDTYQYNGKAKDAKYWHNLEYHSEPMPVPEPVATPAPVVTAAPKPERKPRKAAPVTTDAPAPAPVSVSDVTARLLRLETLITEKVEKEIALAKDEKAQFVDIKTLEATIAQIENKSLPLLLGVPEGYRDNSVIELLQGELASAKSKLAMAMLSPAFIRAEAAKEALDRQERITKATVVVAAHNASIANVTSAVGEEWLLSNTERFNAMVNGDIWIRRGKKSKGEKRIPFMQDFWWGVQTHAKYGLVETDTENYLRPPLAANERTWENIEPIVDEVFDELMEKYSFNFSIEKRYDVRVTSKKVDADGIIVDDKSEVKQAVYRLPEAEWRNRIHDIMHQIWRKTWNKRDASLPVVLAELGYYGEGKEDLGQEFCAWISKEDAKTKMGKMTSMEYAILKSRGELPKDAPVAQPKASSRKRGKK